MILLYIMTANLTENDMLWWEHDTPTIFS